MNDELKRRVCYYCATMPRNAHCGICDPQPSDGALTNEGAEPVAWEIEVSGYATLLAKTLDKAERTAEHYRALTHTVQLEPLYRRHPPKVCTCPSGDGSLRWPCPVHPPEVKALVLPERCVSKLFSAHYVRGWNACLDRVKELNS